MKGTEPGRDNGAGRHKGWLRAFSGWLGGARRSAVSPAPSSAAAETFPARIGHYVVRGKLGQGGMGIVYEARDERLGRTVAIKTMSSLRGDEMARRRFWREARAAATVNHPNICQIYEVGEDGGELFLAMELLEGETLADRLSRGPLSVGQAVPVELGILGALGALHAHGIVHRDLKPSNAFLTPHGVKLLDFGLARTTETDVAKAMGSLTALTYPGIVIGTPQYMSPEQIQGEEVDARTDLFAAGGILFEMLAGRPAFTGRNVIEVLHATLHEQPPALTGSPAVAAVDRVIRRALAKNPADRPPSAEAMADELRALQGTSSAETPVLARALTRLVVLPFRVLRADPETDFLAFSLPDAISSSLSRFGSMVVRSSATAARFIGEVPDLKALAAEADVDRVVLGTLLRSGDQLQATAQLVEAPGGTLLTSHTVVTSLGDLFRLQQDIVRRVVDALTLSLSGEISPTPNSPHDAQAYALYLRANEMSRHYERLPEAREIYSRCLELDPSFAPAWAQLGRCHWVISKYIHGSDDAATNAEQAFRRALEIDPRLTLAHKHYANLEADTGHPTRALVRLLEQAADHPNDPELFAGLVHASRYCGLNEQSVAAHDEARRLDPNVPTSVAQTLLMTGDADRVLAVRPPIGAGSGDEGIRVISLGLAGRREEALRELQPMRRAAVLAAFRPWTDFLQAWLERRPEDMVAIRTTFPAVRIMEDPEAAFQEGWLYCDVGEHERGLALLRQGVNKGYFVASTLADAPAFDALRKRPEFEELLTISIAGRERALAEFVEAGGERLLGS